MCSQQFIHEFLKKHTRYKSLKDFLPLFEFMHDIRVTDALMEDLAKLLASFSIPVREIDGIYFIKATISEHGRAAFIKKAYTFGICESLSQVIDNQFYTFDGRNLHTYGDLKIVGYDHFYLYKDSALDSYFLKKNLTIYNTADNYKLLNKSMGI